MRSKSIPRKQLDQLIASLDLLILDADGTVAPHMTVAIANDIVRRQYMVTIFGIDKDPHFSKRLLNTKETAFEMAHFLMKTKLKLSKSRRHYKRLLWLFSQGLGLHILKKINDLMDFFGIREPSSARLIKGFIQVLQGEDISEFLYEPEVIKESMYPGIIDVLNYMRKRNVILKTAMISQSFGLVPVGKEKGFLDQYVKILKLDDLVSNSIEYDRAGKINKISVDVKCADDKLKVAKQLIKKYRAKKVGIIINDYSDIKMAEMPETRLIIARNPPLKIRKLAHIVVNDNYEGLIS